MTNCLFKLYKLVLNCDFFVIKYSFSEIKKRDKVVDETKHFPPANKE